MKVGTDGIMLGAWADLSDSATNTNYSVLDVGTGTGLIALMVAQRSKTEVVAIELDPISAKQACENIIKSPWSGRIKIIIGDFQKPGILKAYKFKHIICNPPFFSNDLQSPEQRRNRARHDIALSLNGLVSTGADLLDVDGKISLILPPDRFTEAEELLKNRGLFLTRMCTVSSREDGGHNRVLAEWSLKKQSLISNHLNIYLAKANLYHQDYIDLTREFYQNF